jgi:hypothetical protein
MKIGRSFQRRRRCASPHDGAERRPALQIKLNKNRVSVMPNRTASYRGYEIKGSISGKGWSVEVHPRGPDFPILSQGAFRSTHPSWNAAVAEATSRVDAVLDDRGIEPNLPAALQEVLEDAWEIVGSSSRAAKSGSYVKTQLRQALARCIVALAATGITDRNELRREAVERIVLGEGVDAYAGSSLISQ